jgi:DNA (cytosine-5)-methyltransferase 1
MRGPSFYEFFAGGGMARAGLGPSWNCLFANDFDPKKADAYRANWGDRELFVGDVAAVSTLDLPGEADLVWASFPCQDLSLAGNGAGLKGERSGSFWPFWRLVRQLRRERRAPKTVVLENVCGLLTSHGGQDFQALCQTVASGGYWLGAMVIDAAYFLPQSRPRLFVVAVRDDLPIPGQILTTAPTDIWHPVRLQEAWTRLPEPLKMRWLWLDPPLPVRRNSRFADLIEREPTGVTWHTPTETERLLGMMSPVNRAKVDAAMASGRFTVGGVYKRTRWEGGRKVQRAEVRFDDVAGCLRTPGGGSSRQTIIVVEDGQVRTRLISARETARLMGLPDEYRLPERYNDAYHLTGDGVAVPVVRHIAHCILEPVLTLAGSPMVVAAE